MKSHFPSFISATLLLTALAMDSTAAPAPPPKWPVERNFGGDRGKIERPNVVSLAFSPDGKLLAAGDGWDGTVRLWDVANGKNIATWKHSSKKKPFPPKMVLALAFSPDSKTVASGGDDTIIKLWDVKSGKNTATFEGRQGTIVSLSFSPDSKTLVSAGADRATEQTVRLWDCEAKKERDALKVPSAYSPVVEYGSSDKPLIASLDLPVPHQSSFSLRRMGTEMPPVICGGRGYGSLGYELAVSRDGKTAATFSRLRTVRVWDTSSGREIATCTLHERYSAPAMLVHLALSPDGKILACGYGHHSGVITLYEASSGKVLGTRKNISVGMAGLTFSPDGRFLAVGCGDTIKIWRLPTHFKAE